MLEELGYLRRGDYAGYSVLQVDCFGFGDTGWGLCSRSFDKSHILTNCLHPVSGRSNSHLSYITCNSTLSKVAR